MTDLEWLARNVHEWDGPLDIGGVKVNVNCEIGRGVVGIRKDLGKLFSKAEWLAKRAELQNKPSWDEAPEWANWLAQDNDGEWCWRENKLIKLSRTFHSKEGRFDYTNRGEVLGNWQDTLEERPEKHTFVDIEGVEREMTESQAKALHAAMNSGLHPVDDFASQEQPQWNGEGLPPVGCECRIQSDDEDWQDCTIVFIDDREIVYRPYGKSLRAAHFWDLGVEPLKTDRQKAVDELTHLLDEVSDEHAVDDFCMGLADYLYSQGYRKVSDNG